VGRLCRWWGSRGAQCGCRARRALHCPCTRSCSPRSGAGWAGLGHAPARCARHTSMALLPAPKDDTALAWVAPLQGKVRAEMVGGNSGAPKQSPVATAVGWHWKHIILLPLARCARAAALASSNLPNATSTSHLVDWHRPASVMRWGSRLPRGGCRVEVRGARNKVRLWATARAGAGCWGMMVGSNLAQVTWE
jgi:hypothetical protein